MRRRTKSRAHPGSVRIIGGEWRRRRLVLPPGTAVRPTPDRVRETLFNWLGQTLRGADCLDLFAGSGALGFEALSRGARSATLIERDAVLAAALVEHARRLGASADVIAADAMDYLTSASRQRFDVAFVDPPFDEPVEPILVKLLPHMRPRAAIYVERPADEGLPSIESFRWRKTGKAGSVCFGVAERPAPD